MLNQPMTWQKILLLLLVLLFLLKKLYANKPFVKKFNIYISMIVFSGLIVLIASEFWYKKMWLAIVLIIAAVLAMLKIISDFKKSSE